MSSNGNEQSIRSHLDRIRHIMLPLLKRDLKVEEDKEDILKLKYLFKEYKNYYEDLKRFVDEDSSKNNDHVKSDKGDQAGGTGCLMSFLAESEEEKKASEEKGLSNCQQQDIKALKEEVAKMEKKMSEEKEHSNCQQQDIKALKEEVAKMEKKMSEEKEHSNCQQDIKALKEEAAKMEKKMSEEKEHSNCQQQDIKVLKQEVAKMRVDLDELSIERGMVYIGEAASIITKASLKKVPEHQPLSLPEPDLYTDEECVMANKAKLHQRDFDRFCVGAYEVKCTLSHDSSNMSLESIKAQYDQTAAAMKRSFEDEERIMSKRLLSSRKIQIQNQCHLFATT